MRKIFLLSIFCFLCFQSCKKDDHFKKAENAFEVTQNMTRKTGTSELWLTGDELMLHGVTGAPNESVVFMKVKFAGTGKYDLYNDQASYYTTLGGDAITSEYVLDKDARGELEINSYDPKNNRIEGKFKFTVKKRFSNRENDASLMDFKEGRFKGTVKVIPD